MHLYHASVYVSNFGKLQGAYAHLTERERELYAEGMQHVLESYHYVKNETYLKQVRADGKKFFLDSGAFSAFTMGVTIDLPKFCDYCHRNADVIHMVSVLDSIGDPDGTWRNQMRMEDLGVKPLPCFHYGEPTEILEWYVSRYEYITIGGMVPISNGQLELWLDRIWEEHLTDSDGKPRCKVHGFGLTSPHLMQKYPWHCMTDEHEVLTRCGWVGREQVSAGDEILCFDDGVARWESVAAVPVFDVVDAPLHCFDYRTFSARVTPNHNWRVFDQRIGQWRWVTTEKLLPRYGIPRAPTSYESAPVNGISDAYAEMMGWFWTEGSIKDRSKRGYLKPSVVLYQSETANPDKVARIRQVLKQCDEKHCVYPVHRRNGTTEIVFELYGELRDWLLQWAPNKVIDWGFLSLLTEQQVKLFVEASVSGDGWRRDLMRRPVFSLRQAKPDNIDLFRAACLLAGYPTSRENNCHNVNASSVPWCYPSKHKPDQHQVKNYTGKVWCVQVPSRAFFTRCNGKIYVTGNSVDSSTWQAMGSNGSIMLPSGKALAVSANAAQRKVPGQHVDTLTPPQREAVRATVEAAGCKLEDMAKHHSHRWVWNVWQMPRVAQERGHRKTFVGVEQRLF